MPARPDLAGCVITDTVGRVLMLHRNTDERRQWEIPGGGIEFGEQAAEAAVREANEELGLTVNVVGKLGGMHFDQDGEKIHYTWLEAVIAESSNEPALREPEVHDDWRYFTIAELAVMASELSPNARNLVQEILNRRVRSNRIAL
jgi:8-oxo-dGTP pyrophosphatase MutT (NUDIX family)